MYTELPQRLKEKIAIDDLTGCWRWTGSVFRKPYGNYGQLRVTIAPKKSKVVRAHRYVYEMYNGSIPKDLEVDHVCRNTLCINPKHLEAVTHTENMRRRPDVFASHCKKGHEFTPTNTYIRPSDQKRECRECKKQAMDRFLAKKQSL